MLYKKSYRAKREYEVVLINDALVLSIKIVTNRADTC